MSLSVSLLIIGGIIIWATCVALIYGALFANAHRSWSFESNRREALRQDAGMSMVLALVMFGCFGPLGLLIIFLLTGFFEHGFKFRIVDDFPEGVYSLTIDGEVIKPKPIARRAGMIYKDHDLNYTDQNMP